MAAVMAAVKSSAAPLNKAVAKMIKIIAEESVAIEAEAAHVQAHGLLPPATVEEAIDAVGSLVVTRASLRVQINEMVQSLSGKYDPDYITALAAPLQKDFDAVAKQLTTAVHLFATVWKLKLPPKPTAAGDSDALQRLELANDPGKLTVVGVIGWIYLDDPASAAADAPIQMFLQARTAVGQKLTASILTDIDSYQAEFTKQAAAAPPGTLDQVEAAAQAAKGAVPSPQEIERLTVDPDAPPPEQIEHALHNQRKAAPTAISLYLVVAALIASTPAAIGAYCVPGPVKGLRRMVAKTIAKYASFAFCRDIARCTVHVPTLAALLAFLEALLQCGNVLILRVKNRFAFGYDPLPAGGYRDVQLLLLLPDGGAKAGSPVCHRYAELQINLKAMVEIKEGVGGGGHAAFNLARAIDAFSPRTLRYKGSPSDAISEAIGAGMLLVADFEGADFSACDPLKFGKALESSQCRLQDLKCVLLPNERMVFWLPLCLHFAIG